MDAELLGFGRPASHVSNNFLISLGGLLANQRDRVCHIVTLGVDQNTWDYHEGYHRRR